MSTNRYNLMRNLLTGWDVVDAFTGMVAEMPTGTPLRGLRKGDAEELCHLMNINLGQAISEPEGNSPGRASADEN